MNARDQATERVAIEAECERLNLKAQTRERLTWLLDSIAQLTRQESESIARATMHVTIGDWGWSTTPSGSALGNTHEDAAAGAIDWLNDEIMLCLRDGSEDWQELMDIKKLAYRAARHATATADSAAQGHGLAGMYAGQIAQVAIAIDRWDDDAGNDRFWTRLVGLWDEVVVRKEGSPYPDPLAEAWRRKPGSASNCLGWAITMISVSLLVAVLLVRTLIPSGQR